MNTADISLTKPHSTLDKVTGTIYFIPLWVSEFQLWNVCTIFGLKHSFNGGKRAMSIVYTLLFRNTKIITGIFLFCAKDAQYRIK